jgi:hypothetical protein
MAIYRRAYAGLLDTQAKAVVIGSVSKPDRPLPKDFCSVCFPPIADIRDRWDNPVVTTKAVEFNYAQEASPKRRPDKRL